MTAVKGMGRLIFGNMFGLKPARTQYVNPKKGHMNTMTLRGNWNVIKGKLKQRYAHLTDNDLVFEEGKEDELIGHIQRKVGCTRDELIRFIDEECEC